MQFAESIFYREQERWQRIAVLGGIMKKDASGSVRIAAKIRELINSGELDAEGCQHFTQLQDVVPSADGCEDCLKIGDNWVHLRVCMTCGHVGCCDASKNKHATRHFHETHHPVIVSYEPGENWLWCYVEEVLLTP
jgi:uncharacterized UBP type Zn finger protein